MAPVPEPRSAQFLDFKLDLASGELFRNGNRSRLQGQPFRVLCLLLEKAGDVVTREELQRQLWPNGTFVDFEHGLNKSITKLREALDDPKASSRLIETLPRRGYRFTAEVNWIGPHATEEAIPSGHRQRIPFWLLGGLAFLFLVAASLWLNRGAIEERFGHRTPIHSVAILPFVNLSNDPEQDYFTDGMTEDLITNLSYVKSLRVLSRNSTMRFRGSPLSTSKIAEQLNVDAVIEGSVFRIGNKVRINIRLTARDPERQLWTANYERDLEETIALQGQIAADAVAQLRTDIAPEEHTRLTLESRINPQAYDEYLRARYLLAQETDPTGKAIPHLEQAIALDPKFAAAYAALGEAWGLQGVWGTWSNRDASKKGLQYSEKAVSLDPSSPEAYASMGHSLMQSHRWNEGEAALRQALKLDPNNTEAGQYLALLLAEKGRVDEALVISRELARANPVALDLQRNYANMLYRNRHYDEAIAQCQRILDLDPSHLATYVTLANALVEKGRYQEAEAAFKQGQLIDPGVQAWLDVREGDISTARQILKSNSSLVNVHSAVARYLTGEQETGLKQLDFLANETWAIKTYNLRNDPTFDPLRNDPRFNTIVKKTGLLDN